jgi:uncharacterized protein YegL
MSNQKDGFDEFGNPQGKAYDLGGLDDERLRGENALLYVAYVPNILMKAYGENYEWHLAQQALAERNLKMEVRFAPGLGKCGLNEKLLADFSQLWYVSDRTPTLTGKQVQMIKEYVDKGNGLLIWADNEPFFADANILAKNIIGTEFSGNKYGDKVLVLGDTLSPGHYVEHPLTQGVNNLYEGITICTIAPAEHLTILAQSHDGQMCMACYEKGNQRIVLDTGFTKLIKGAFNKTAGTARYFRNIAFWLSRGARNVEYKSFTPGRESLATINPGASSEKYKYLVTQPVNVTYILHWEGAASLGLVIQDPQGKIIHDSASAKAPIRVDVTANMPGDWLCWVRGVNVPRRDFPYVLTLVLHKGAPVAVANVTSTPAVSAVKRLPVYVLVDGSSRASDFASNLDMGVRILADRLRGRLRKGAAASLGLILADEDGQESVPLTEVERFSLPKLSRRGKCGLGKALAKLNASLAAHPSEGKPLVIVILTGAPEDDWGRAADQLRNLAVQGRANVFVLGVGGYADGPMMRRLTNATPLSLPVLTQVYTQQVFDWLFQIADMVMSGMESGLAGQKRSAPPPPACLKIVN